jgi:hypothetical protein
MRIVDRKTFLALPENTVYAKFFHGDSFNELQIKGETWTNDFIYEDLNDFDDHDTSEERYEKIDKMIQNGEIFPLRLNSCSRDGLYEEDQLFAIYDKEDITKIITRLYLAIK